MFAASEISRRRFVASTVSILALADLPASATKDSAMHATRKHGMTMTTLTPYLLFDGTCQQAMEFYKSCFGGELTAIKVKDSPIKDQMPTAQQDKTLNARLRSSTLEISASDWLAPNETPVRGNTVCLFLSGGTLQELKTIFDRLSEGAQVTDPLKEMFFGIYGALNDRFGVRWMFQSDQKT